MSLLSHSVHSAYLKELVEAGKDIRNEGVISGGESVFQATEASVLLTCQIESAIVIRAMYSIARAGAPVTCLPFPLVTPLPALMGRFCEVLKGCSIQEGAEHGVIVLEKQLRDVNVPPPVRGIVTPDNADPIFALPKALVRHIYAKWLESKKTEAKWNDFDRPVSSQWKSASALERLEKVNGALPSILKEVGLSSDCGKALGIKGETRVVLARHVFFKSSSAGSALMRIERGLKMKVEPKIEVVLECVDDKNNRVGRAERDSLKNGEQNA